METINKLRNILDSDTNIVQVSDHIMNLMKSELVKLYNSTGDKKITEEDVNISTIVGSRENHIYVGVDSELSDKLIRIHKSNFSYTYDLEEQEFEYKRGFEDGFKQGKDQVNEKVLKALKRLVELKHWKEAFGKDEHYLECKPKAWEEAEEILKLWE